MTQKNKAKAAETQRIEEYFEIGDTIEGGEILIDSLETRIANIRAMRSRLEHRLEQITAELAPRFAEVGPIQHRHGDRDFVVLHIEDEPTLTVETLGRVGDLTVDCRPRFFSNEDLIEAAKHAAVTGEFPEFDEDPQDEYLYALERVGALDPGDDSILLSSGDSIRLPGRTATIYRGVTVADQEAG